MDICTSTILIINLNVYLNRFWNYLLVTGNMYAKYFHTSDLAKMKLTKHIYTRYKKYSSSEKLTINNQAFCMSENIVVFIDYKFKKMLIF